MVNDLQARITKKTCIDSWGCCATFGAFVAEISHHQPTQFWENRSLFALRGKLQTAHTRFGCSYAELLPMEASRKTRSRPKRGLRSCYICAGISPVKSKLLTSLRAHSLKSQFSHLKMDG